MNQQQKRQQEMQEEYRELIQESKPKPPVLRNCILAFMVGGLICLIGQVIFQLYLAQRLGVKEAQTATAATMIFLGALLTGLGIYDVIGKYGGAGAIVPITGFANSIVAPAMEFKREGFIFGVGARIFTTAGPVLVYGFLFSVLIGIIYYLLP